MALVGFELEVSSASVPCRILLETTVVWGIHSLMASGILSESVSILNASEKP